jgi:hypothetical protein
MSLTPTQKKKIRAAISDYCLRAEDHQIAWHYTQQRPITGYGQAPDHGWFAADCSGYLALIFEWAGHQAGVRLDSPLGAPHGWGYTGTEVAWLIENGRRVVEANGYLVGDIAINGSSPSNTDHTFICRKAGSAKTSVWSSNGNEHAPEPVGLHYHPMPLVGVWRHPALL